MLLIFPVVLLMIFILSISKMKPQYSNSANKAQQQRIRGICNIAIMFSHSC